jgi:hypothetical protein
VQSALFGIRVFPPPTAGTHIFTRLNGTRAWLAANGWKSFVVQHIVWHLVTSNVIPHLFFCPPGQGVYLYYLVVFIPFNNIDVLAGYRL